MKPRVAIIGASDHGVVLADAVRAGGAFELAGFFDRNAASVDSSQLPAPVLGVDVDLLAQLKALCISGVFLGLGDNASRQRCWESLRQTLPEGYFSVLIHPAASVSPSARLDNGAVILAGAVVGPQASVGKFALLNTASTLDHHGQMAPFSSLAPGAHTGGRVTIGEGSAVCLGAQVTHGRSIGKNSVVGAGAVVLRDVPDAVVVFGVPARVIRRREPGERYL